MGQLQVNIDSLREQVESQQDIIVANTESIQSKDEKYLKLMNEYQNLEKDYNSKLMNVKHIENVDDNNFMIKSLREDKENLENVNKRLKEQTNVYRFKSAAHQKIAQSAK